MNSKTVRVLTACLVGLLPFIVLPAVSDLVKDVVLPNGAPLQKAFVHKLLIAVLVVSAGFAVFGPGRLGFVWRPIFRKRQWIWVLPAVFIVVNLSQGGEVQIKDRTVWYLIGWAMAVGIWEETVYRGIMFHLLHPMGALAFVLLGGFWFGLVHYQLGSLSVFYATGIGLAIATAYAMTRTIFPAIAIHAAINFTSQQLDNANPYFHTIAMVTTVVVCLISFVVLWRSPVIMGECRSVQAAVGEDHADTSGMPTIECANPTGDPLNFDGRA